MNKLLWRYLIYFGIFICFVQIMESAPLQDAFAKVGLKMNFESLGTYAPLFLSALLIDITYRIGKRQNEIAERQNQIELHKLYKELYTTVYEIDQFSRKFVGEMYEVLAHSKDENNYMLECMDNKISTLQDDLKEIEISFRLLRSSKDCESFESMNTLLSLSYVTLNDVRYTIKEKTKQIPNLQLPTTEDCNNVEADPKELYVKELINILLTKNSVEASYIMLDISSFIRYRKDLFDVENNILDRIKTDAQLIIGNSSK